MTDTLHLLLSSPQRLIALRHCSDAFVLGREPCSCDYFEFVQQGTLLWVRRACHTPLAWKKMSFPKLSTSPLRLRSWTPNGLSGCCKLQIRFSGFSLPLPPTPAPSTPGQAVLSLLTKGKSKCQVCQVRGNVL